MLKVHPPTLGGLKNCFLGRKNNLHLFLLLCTLLPSPFLVKAQLIPQLSLVHPSCFGSQDGQIQVSVDGGQGPYSYQWSNGQSTAILEQLPAGTYGLTVTDATGASGTTTAQLQNPSPLMVIVTPVQPSCPQSDDGELILEVWQGKAPYSFVWSDNASGGHRRGLTVGSYEALAIDANGCEKSIQIDLDAASQLNAGALGEPASCDLMNDGLLTASAQYGQQPYSYVWSTGDSTQVVENVEPGYYELTVTDALGCVDTAHALVQTNFAVDMAGSALLCGPGPTSQLNIVANGGTAPYEYHWNTGDVSPEMSNLSEGTYTITITDANNCKTVEKIEIVPSDFSISVIPRDVLCQGDSTGSVLVQASGGEPPYQILWSTGDTTDLIEELIAGSYSVTVTDDNGCQLEESVKLEEPDALLVDFEQTNVSCGGAADGKVKINPTGGKAPYSFLWSHNQIFGELNNLEPGDYTVTVSDANLCEEIIELTITGPEPLELEVDLFLIDCDGSRGGMTAQVSGGVGPYEYRWSNGDSTMMVTELPAGTYGVTITDANQCTISMENLIIDGAPPFQLDLEVQDIECSDEDTGSIEVVVEGGSPPFSYEWSTGQTNKFIDNLSVGEYALTVTDADGCKVSTSATVGRSLPVVLSISTQDIACAGQQNGIAKAEVSGGLSPYFYTWNTGNTGSSIVNLSPGTYSLTITDSAGCTASDTVEIISPDTLKAIPSFMDISCFGEVDGQASVSVSGGVPPYEYSWGNGGTDSLIQNLPAGIYGVVVRDAMDCIVTASITISEPPPLTLSLIIENVPCEGNSSGMIRSTTSGGVQPYSYLWSNGDSTDILLDAASGMYTLQVTDASGCTIEANATLNATPGLQISLEQQDVLCFGQNNGVLEATVEGGLEPLSYQWSNGNRNTKIANLSPGTYALTVTDDNGCYDTISTLISEPPALTIDMLVQNISCAGEADGSASAIVGGGMAPYRYAWGTGDTTATIEDLSVGIYGLIVEDQNACIEVASVEITQPTPLELSFSVENEPCEGNADGFIQTTVQGGVLPYEFIWNTGDTSQNLSQVMGGMYSLTVTDSSGCQVSGVVELLERPGLVLSVLKSDISCFGEVDGTASALVLGGTAPFSYNWSTGDASESLSGLGVDEYALTVTDQAGCYDTLAFTIDSPDSLRAKVVSLDVSCFGSADGLITVEVNGGTMPYDLMWSNDSTGTILSDLGPGDFELQLTDANGCDLIEKISIAEPDSLWLEFDIGKLPCGSNEDGQISVEVFGGVPEYEFSWSTGDTKAGIGDIGSGAYSLTVTDQNNCQVIDTVILPATPELFCTIETVQEVTMGGDGALEVLIDGGTEPYQIVWSNGDTTALIDSLDFGEYEVSITDANGCMTSCLDTLMGLASLGSFVWLDENRDGIQDPEEEGFPNVSIQIVGVDSANMGFTATTTTDETGAYLFEVPPGQYVLEFTLPTGFILTIPNEGMDDERDSDIDPITFASDTISLSPRAQMLNIDAGCISECDPVTEPGRINASTNYLCGSGNDPGPILNIASPAGGSGETEYLWMQSTFNGPIGGGYWQPIPDSNTPTYDPGPLYETTYFVRCVRREKCPTYVESNIVRIEVGTEAVAIVDLPARICEKEDVVFRSVGSGAEALIQWTFGGSATQNFVVGDSAALSFSSFGSFQGKLEVEENGCLASRIFSFNVINNPLLCNSPLQVQAEVLDEANREVELSWDQPETEDTLRYEIQFSPDGIHFRPLAVREHLGLVSSGVNARYAWQDRAPKPGRNYFRVMVSDATGRRAYSAVHQLIFSAGSTIAMLFPNPVRETLHLEFFETFGEEVRVELYDFQGTLLAQQALETGEDHLMFPVGNLSSGIYFARIYYGEVPVKHLRFYKN
ncbi:MAG: T9SS type A sorting domain-containing protein [Saprospiraceae bacterium]|nr:T9SS type A sorting domain-containing protein [Saprospiraceae bacterium]